MGSRKNGMGVPENGSADFFEGRPIQGCNKLIITSISLDLYLVHELPIMIGVNFRWLW